MTGFCGVNHLLALLVAATVARGADPSRSLASERSSIESTYELTKYLEYQLKEIKDVYLTYLGPPFNDKDFSPPRPNSTALSLPSAATRLELWHGLENQARLAQNQRAYSILLAAVRELARSTLCPSLKTSLLQFCTGLDGLLGSISALMTTLGYSSYPPSANTGDVTGELQYLQRDTGGNRPAPLVSQTLYRSRAGSRTESGQVVGSQRKGGMKMVRGEREDGVSGEAVTRRKGKEGKRAEGITSGGRSSGLRERGKGERGRRDKREEPERSRMDVSKKETAGIEEEAVENWGKRRLLSIDEDGREDDRQLEFRLEVSYLDAGGAINQKQRDDNQFSFNLNSHHFDTLREEDGFILGRSRSLLVNAEKQPDIDVISSFSHLQKRRSPRSFLSATLQPPVSTLSLLYQLEGGEEHTLLPQTVPLSIPRSTSLLSPPASLLSVRPTMNDFAKKVEGFWILRELQSWLWRSAKDFNRLKRKLRG